MPPKTASNDAAEGHEPAFVKAPEAARLLGMGYTRLNELEKTAGFPRPVWLGPRGKRFVRQELVAWALAQRQAPRTEAAQ